jgi:hypothetical protein
MNQPLHIQPDWRWGTPEGSREFDRLTDRLLTFREKLEWLEEAETFSLRLQAGRKRKTGDRKLETGK